MVRQTIAAFMHAIEAVDPYLGGQSSYMANLGGDLVKTLGLSEEDESTVRTAASLSQIGKMQLPRELLTKPAPSRRKSVRLWSGMWNMPGKP